MRLLRRLAYWLRLSSHASDLADEVALHREMLERDLIRQGMSPDAAREQARRRMGNDTYMREEARAVWLPPSLEALWQDTTYALRGLRRNPTFTAGVVLTLALGIGANSAMFTLVDRLFFRPPALMTDPATAHRVYLYRRTIGGVETERGGGIYARYADLERWTTSFSLTAGFALRPLAVGTGSEAQLRDVGVVSASFFDFFDAAPVLGRYYTATEDAPPVPAAVVVLSRVLWRTAFGSRSDVLGSTLHIGAAAYTIIGVAPDGFVGLWPYRPPAAFIPVAAFAATRGRPDWATSYTTAFGLGIIVRRKPGVTIDRANADLSNALARSYQAQNEGRPGARPNSDLRPRAVAASVLAERRPEASNLTRIARWLSGVTLIVLLIACANVGNLLLARTIRRRREIAVRVALGVSRSRLFRLLLTEGLLLALFGGAASLVIAKWGAGLLHALYLPGSGLVSLFTDPRTLLFTGAIALGAGVVTSLVPMVQVGRGGLTADLKSAARAGTYQRRRLRTALVVLQCSLSVVLLVGAGLFVRSLGHVRDVPLGFAPDSVLLVSLDMRDVRLDSAARVALRLRLLESAVRAPGVAFASLQESVPFAEESSRPIFVSGDSAGRYGTFYHNAVSPDYFRVMGTRVLRGRPIESTDVGRGPRVAVVSESMAAALWPGQDPIGQCFRIAADTMPCTSVVGVAQDIHARSVDEPPNLFYYMPAAQWRPEEGGLFVRTRGEARPLQESVRRHLQREMPGTSFVTVRPLADVVDATLRSWIVGATAFTALGVLALLLAAVGLYSVIAYGVTQRRHELGVRLALGAARAGIVRHVVMEGLGFALLGIAIGGGVALAAGRWIRPLLFEQSAYDPGVFAVVTVVLLAVAVAAGCVPGFRAAGVDPRTALQAE